MTLDESKKLLADMYDALNAQDLEAQHKYWHDDMVWHGPPGFGDIHGIENFKYKVLKPFYEAFPDYHVKNDIVVAEGCLLYTSPSPRDRQKSRMPSSA